MNLSSDSCCGAEFPIALEAMDEVNTCRCPACGNRVRLSGSVIRWRGRVETERLDLLARVACGCYVLTMPAGQVGRLLASVLAAGSNEDRLYMEPVARANA